MKILFILRVNKCLYFWTEKVHYTSLSLLSFISGTMVCNIFFLTWGCLYMSANLEIATPKMMNVNIIKTFGKSNLIKANPLTNIGMPICLKLSDDVLASHE
jgi:hypothetical protein